MSAAVEAGAVVLSAADVAQLRGYLARAFHPGVAPRERAAARGHAAAWMVRRLAQGEQPAPTDTPAAPTAEAVSRPAVRAVDEIDGTAWCVGPTELDAGRPLVAFLDQVGRWSR